MFASAEKNTETKYMSDRTRTLTMLFVDGANAENKWKVKMAFTVGLATVRNKKQNS